MGRSASKPIEAPPPPPLPSGNAVFFRPVNPRYIAAQNEKERQALARLKFPTPPHRPFSEIQQVPDINQRMRIAEREVERRRQVNKPPPPPTLDLALKPLPPIKIPLDPLNLLRLVTPLEQQPPRLESKQTRIQRYDPTIYDVTKRKILGKG